MAVLTFPSITPDTLDFGIKYNTQVSTTSLSGITQTVELPGARWGGSMHFRDLNPADSAALKGFLLRLRGSSGRFYYGDLSHPEPFNTITGEPLAIGGSSSARVLFVSPTNGGSGGVFSVGDYVQVGNDETRELKMVVGVTGTTTQQLTIEPLMRRTDYTSLNLYYTNPKGVFLLDADDHAKWSVRSKALLSDISFGFVEG